MSSLMNTLLYSKMQIFFSPNPSKKPLIKQPRNPPPMQPDSFQLSRQAAQPDSTQPIHHAAWQPPTQSTCSP